jgi:hypothetical protein
MARRMIRGTPARGIVIGCLVLALASVVLLSWPPSSDPFAWITWGQEVTNPHVTLTINGGPSWKPFPVFFTTIFGLFGNAGPDLWLMLVRTIGLLALYGAFRLGRRFAGVPAGVIAAVALLLLQDYLRYMARGTSEPLVLASVLWAIELHFAHHRRWAYALIVLGALNRPELFAFVGLYAIYLWVTDRGSRPLAVAGILLIPFGWLVPPWINTGNAFQANSAALGGQGGASNGIALLGTSPSLMTPPIVLLAVVGAGLAAWKRDRAILGLAVLALVWAFIAALETQVSFGTMRYLLPGAAIGCVLAGVAVVRLAQLAGERLGGTWVPWAVGVLIVVLSLPWMIPRAGRLGSQVREANLAGHLQHGLFLAVSRAGGRGAIVPCRRSVVAVNHTMASALAWKLEIPLTRSNGVLRRTGVVFTHGKTEPAGSPPVIRHRASRRLELIARAEGWCVLRVTGLSSSGTPHCAPADRLTYSPAAKARPLAAGSPVGATAQQRSQHVEAVHRGELLPSWLSRAR